MARMDAAVKVWCVAWVNNSDQDSEGSQFTFVKLIHGPASSFLVSLCFQNFCDEYLLLCTCDSVSVKDYPMVSGSSYKCRYR